MNEQERTMSETQLHVVVVGAPGAASALSASGRFESVRDAADMEALRELLVGPDMRGLTQNQLVFLVSDVAPELPTLSLWSMIAKLTGAGWRVAVLEASPNARDLVRHHPAAGFLPAPFTVNAILGGVSGLGLGLLDPVEDGFAPLDLMTGVAPAAAPAVPTTAAAPLSSLAGDLFADADPWSAAPAAAPVPEPAAAAVGDWGTADGWATAEPVETVTPVSFDQADWSAAAPAAAVSVPAVAAPVAADGWGPDPSASVEADTGVAAAASWAVAAPVTGGWADMTVTEPVSAPVAADTTPDPWLTSAEVAPAGSQVAAADGWATAEPVSADNWADVKADVEDIPVASSWAEIPAVAASGGTPAWGTEPAEVADSWTAAPDRTDTEAADGWGVTAAPVPAPAAVGGWGPAPAVNTPGDTTPVADWAGTAATSEILPDVAPVGNSWATAAATPAPTDSWATAAATPAAAWGTAGDTTSPDNTWGTAGAETAATADPWASAVVAPAPATSWGDQTAAPGPAQVPVADNWAEHTAPATADAWATAPTTGPRRGLDNTPAPTTDSWNATTGPAPSWTTTAAPLSVESWNEIVAPAPLNGGGRRGRAAKGRVIVVTVSKGGVGKSTLTLNLGVLLGRTLRATDRVCIVDANLQQADIGKHLNVYSPNLFSLVRSPQDLNDERIGRHMVHKDELGVWLMLGPATPDEANPLWITAQLYNNVIDVLRRQFDYIIIDTPVAEGFHDLFRDFILPQADFIVVPVNPASHTMFNTAQWLELICRDKLAGGEGINPDQIGIVLNGASAEIGVGADEVRRELPAYRFLGEVPHDFEWVNAANDTRVMVTTDSTAQQALARILYGVTGEEALLEIANTPKGKRGGSTKGRRGLLGRRGR
jgi:MinD-like ATPase involved in chromosome partitioning or flagellar assembly